MQKIYVVENKMKVSYSFTEKEYFDFLKEEGLHHSKMIHTCPELRDGTDNRNWTKGIFRFNRKSEKFC